VAFLPAHHACFPLLQTPLVHLWCVIAVKGKTVSRARFLCPLSPAADAYGALGRGNQVPPSAAVEVELQLLSWNKVEDVTPNGLVVKKILEASSEWKKPNEGSQVRARPWGGRGVAGSIGRALVPGFPQG